MPHCLPPAGRSNVVKRRTLLASLAGLPLTQLLTACGGGGEDTDTEVRLINASVGYAALDLEIDGDERRSEVAYGTASDYASVEDGEELSVVVKSSTGGTVNTGTHTFSSDTRYALVAYGWSGDVSTILITEDEDEPDSGEAKIRVLNLSDDEELLDAYIGSPDGTVDEAIAIDDESIATGDATPYYETDSGEYRIWISGQGDRSDVRLDIPSVTLSSKDVYTLLLTQGVGGVLLHGVLVKQEASATAFENGSARVRVAAGVSGNGVVNVDVGDVTAAAGLTSPEVTTYVSVPAGTQGLTVTVDGNAVTADDLDAEAGGDYTVLVYGNASSPQVEILTDDNRRSTTTTLLKIRLINGAEGLSANPTLTVDSGPVASNVAAGTASTYATEASSTSAKVAVTVAASNIFFEDEVVLAAQEVRDVFVLGGASSPTGIMRRTREAPGASSSE
jgi:hypothetical protein